MRGSEYTCYSMSNNGENNFDDQYTYNEAGNDTYDEIGIKRNYSFECDKDCTRISEKEGKGLKKLGSCKHSLENKSKSTVKYFVNNYDHLPNKGPVFEIKKVARKTKPKATAPNTRKRSRQSEAAPAQTVQPLSKPSLNTKENTQKKAFKITKNNEKKEVASKGSPEYETDCDKFPKEAYRKLSKDALSSPYTTPDDHLTNIFTTQKIRESKEDKKISESQMCIFSCKKVAKPNEGEQGKKQKEDDFKDFLFRNTEHTRTTREPKKVTRKLKDDPLKLYTLTSERI